MYNACKIMNYTISLAKVQSDHPVVRDMVMMAVSPCDSAYEILYTLYNVRYSIHQSVQYIMHAIM